MDSLPNTPENRMATSSYFDNDRGIYTYTCPRCLSTLSFQEGQELGEEWETFLVLGKSSVLLCPDCVEEARKHFPISSQTFCSEWNPTTRSFLLWVFATCDHPPVIVLENDVRALRESLQNFRDAFSDLFAQTASNPVYNTWGKQIDCAAMNIASSHAFHTLSMTERNTLP